MPEQFVVRTVIFNVNAGEVVNAIRTVFVTGRPAATIAVEKIGKLNSHSHERMRHFLEGKPIPKSGCHIFESVGENTSTILRVDEVLD